MDDKRTEQFNVRMTAREVRILRAAAEERGLTGGTFLRMLMRDALKEAFRKDRAA